MPVQLLSSAQRQLGTENDSSTGCLSPRDREGQQCELLKTVSQFHDSTVSTHQRILGSLRRPGKRGQRFGGDELPCHSFARANIDGGANAQYQTNYQWPEIKGREIKGAK